jgi:hypothetical protein
MVHDWYIAGFNRVFNRVCTKHIGSPTQVAVEKVPAVQVTEGLEAV